MPKGFVNKLYFGDNLDILRDKVPSESVDLVYLDPPFNSKADYNVLFKTQSGDASTAQATAFKDTWEWDEAAASAFHDLMTDARIPQDLRKLMEALKVFLTGTTGKQGNSMMAYLTMMALRLVELHRVLKPTGSLYLHCDPTASHYIKLILDAVFGHVSFRNELIWKRTSAHSSAKRFGPAHDTILFYTKSGEYVWNPQVTAHSQDHIDSKYSNADDRGSYMAGDLTGAGKRTGDSGKPWRGFDPDAKGRHWAVPNEFLDAILQGKSKPDSTQEKLDLLDAHGYVYWPKKKGGFPRIKRYLTEGIPLQSVLGDISPINSQAQERLGYPTQKPEALMERLIVASSNEGDVVLDPFCGCGTTIAVAERLKRHWIGIDVTYLAVDLMERRLLDMFTPGIDIKRLADFPVQKRRHALRTYWKTGEDELLLGLKPGLSPFEVEGDPKDLSSARFLFENDPFQFEWWCVAMVGAQGREKKGADKGIDGIINFMDKQGEYKRALVSVKGGRNIKREMIATLKGDMEREGAITGILVCLEEPTGPMKREAADAGRWNSDLHPTKSFPRIQILTVADILAGHAPDLPTWGLDVFKKARRARAEAPGQLSLEDQ